MAAFAGMSVGIRSRALQRCQQVDGHVGERVGSHRGVQETDPDSRRCLEGWKFKNYGFERRPKINGWTRSIVRRFFSNSWPLLSLMGLVPSRYVDH